MHALEMGPGGARYNRQSITFGIMAQGLPDARKNRNPCFNIGPKQPIPVFDGCFNLKIGNTKRNTDFPRALAFRQIPSGPLIQGDQRPIGRKGLLGGLEEKTLRIDQYAVIIE